MENKKRTFLEVERLFKSEMRYYPAWLTGTFNICCDETEQRDIIEIGDTIKTIPQFSSLSFRNIYLVLIYVYYSLNLNEQSTDWLNMKFLSDNVEYDEDEDEDEDDEDYEDEDNKNVKLCKKLYYAITTGDIMINDINLSSRLRRKIMGMPMRAGRKTKRNRRKLNKTKRYKTKRYKTKLNKTKKYN
jgi:hypothetical protein